MLNCPGSIACFLQLSLISLCARPAVSLGATIHPTTYLLAHCQRRLKDEALVELVALFLSVWGRWSGTPGVGIPLGSSVSALLSNLYLDPFDHFIKDEMGFKFYGRYADDMAFLSPDRGELEILLEEVRAYLADRLALSLNERKTLFKRTGDGQDFLGYRIFYHHLLLRRKNMKKVRKRLDRMARLYVQGKLGQEDVKRSLAGWMGYARFANTYNFRRRLFAGFKLCRRSQPEQADQQQDEDRIVPAYQQLPLNLPYTE